MTGFTENGTISVCSASRAPSVANDALQTASCFLGTFLSLHLTNDAVHTDLQRVHQATIYALDFNITKRQCFVNASQVRNVTRDAVRCLGNKNIKSPLCSRVHQPG